MKKLANTYGGKFEKGARLDEVDIHGSLLDDARKGDSFAIENVKALYGDGVDDIDEVLENLDKAAEANIIRITPEMKQKILEEGLPSFRMGGSVNNFIAPVDINIFA